MPVSSHVQTARRQPIRVLAVDPRSGIVEGMLKDGGIVQVGPSFGSPFARWPKVNEMWMIEYINGLPNLIGYIETSGEAPVPMSSLEPGEARVDADRTFFSGEVVAKRLHVRADTVFDSPAWAPTPDADSNDTQVATTEFVRDVAGAIDTSLLATDAELAAHEADTTNVHGIADTSALIVTTDPRLSDARTPLAHTHPFTQVTGTLASAQHGDLSTVDTASARHHWNQITNKPTTFTPATHTHAQSDITNLTSDLAAKAPLASPTFTGTPAAPTAAVDTSTTQVATTAFVIGQGYLKSSTASTTYAPISHTHPFTQITGSLVSAQHGDLSTTDTASARHHWNQITNKPTTFAPSAHTHTKGEITDFAHTHPFTEVTGTLSSAQHGDLSTANTTSPRHHWDQITNKPTTFSPSTHSHAQSDITNLTTDLASKAPLASPTFTGVAAFASGTLAAPSITFSADSSTGLYRAGADLLALGVGGTNGMQFAKHANGLVNLSVSGTGTSSVVGLYNTRTRGDMGSTHYGLYWRETYRPASELNIGNYAGYFENRIATDGGVTGTLTGTHYGVRIATSYQAGVQGLTLQRPLYAAFEWAAAAVAAGGSTTTVANVETARIAGPTVPSNGVLTTWQGVYISQPAEAAAGPNPGDVAGSVGTTFGLRIGNMSTGTTNWAIYSEGGASYHLGDLRLGTTTDGGGLLNLVSGTTPASGIAFGTDVNLYRHLDTVPDPDLPVLRTDDRMDAIGGFNAYVASGAAFTNFLATANMIPAWSINAMGTISWGGGSTAHDTNLYRSDANVLKTDDRLDVGSALHVSSYILAANGTAHVVGIGAVTGSGGGTYPGLQFGTATDTNLYRVAADTLKTDDSFVIAGSLTVSGSTTTMQGVVTMPGAIEMGTGADLAVDAGYAITRNPPAWGASARVNALSIARRPVSAGQGGHGQVEIAATGTDQWAELDLRSTRNAVDAKVWNIANRGNDGVFALRTVNDARTSATERLTLTRSGDLYTTGTAIHGVAQMGTSTPHGSNYAQFGYSSLFSGSGTYALLHDNQGRLYINSASGQPIYFRMNNADQGRMETNGELQWYKSFRVIRNQQNGSGATGWADAWIEVRGDSSGYNIPRIAFHATNLSTAIQLRMDAGAVNWFQMVNDAGNGYAGLRAVVENQSDERAKADFEPVDTAAIIDGFKAIPVNKFVWTDPDGEPRQIRYRRPVGSTKGGETSFAEESKPWIGIGPTAQDFHKAFPGLHGSERVDTPLVDENGNPDLTRGAGYLTTDAIGICFAAIKGLIERVEAIEARLNQA